MSETAVEVAASLLEEERFEMVQSARLLHTRLGKLIERGTPAMGFDLPTIVGMLARVRDSVDDYRRAEAVHLALVEAESRRRHQAGGGA